MTTTTNMGTILALALAALLATAASARAETISWAVDADGSWHDAANWDLGRVPASGDDVVIDRAAGGYTITHSTGTTDVASLTCAESLTIVSNSVLAIQGTSSIDGALSLSGDIAVSGDLAVGGLVTWLFGDMTGTGTTYANGGIEFTGGLNTTKKLEGRDLEIDTSAVWDNGFIRISDATITNRAGVVFDVHTDNWIQAYPNSGTFVNHGSFVKSVSDGIDTSHIGIPATTIDVVFDNHGSFELQTGGAHLRRGGTGAGSIASGTGTTLVFMGNHDLTGGPGITSLGDVRFAGSGNTTVDGSYSCSGETKLTGGGQTVVLPGGATTGSLHMESATLTVNGDLTVSGAFEWVHGTMNGAGTTYANDGIEFTGSFQNLFGRDLRISNGAVWQQGGIRVSDGTMTNEAGSTFDARTDGLMQSYPNVGAFVNEGAFVKSASGGGYTNIHVRFDNRGTFDLQIGAAHLTGGGTSGGSFTSAANTLLLFAGDHDLTGGPGIVAQGDLRFTHGTKLVDVIDAGANMTVERGDLTVNTTCEVAGLLTIGVVGSGRLRLPQGGQAAELQILYPAGGLWTDGDLTVPGATVWEYGHLGGIGRLLPLGGLEIRGVDKAISDTITIENSGSCVWRDSGRIYTGNATGATFHNHATGTFDVQGDGVLGPSGYGTMTFVNDGAFLKSAGAGDTQMGIRFENHGTAVVDSGAVLFARGGAGEGSYSGAAETRLHFGGGTGATPFEIHSLDTAGNVVFWNGKSVVAGSYSADQLTRLREGIAELQSGGSAGELSFDGPNNCQLVLGAQLDVEGLFTWPFGYVYGPGTLVAKGGIEMGTAAQKNLYGPIENRGACDWIDGRFYFGNGSFVNGPGATFTVSGAGNMDGAGNFANEGSFRKTAGGADTWIAPSVTNEGSVAVEDGGVTFGGTFTTSGTVSLAPGTTLSCTQAYIQTAGTTTLDGGTLAATGTADIQGGALEGVGTVDADLANAGAVRPGGSSATGTLTVTGDYSGAGSVQIEMESASSFDVLSVGGAASWDAGSTLDLVRLSSFVPATSGVFLVMPYAEYSGGFETVNGTEINAVKDFVLHYDATGGLTLTIDGDDIPPVFGPVTVDPDRLWPPDHELVEVTVTVEVTDDSGEVVTLSATVESDEPDNGLGDGDTDNDIGEVSIDQEAGTITVDLRAERAAQGDGRTYTITITATDTSGNSATTGVKVFVPHDEND